MLTCPRSSLSFHSNAHHHGSLPQQLGMVWDLLLKADPEGPSPIFRAALRHRFHTPTVTPQHVSLQHTDRKSTRLNSSHSQISYAVFCLKKKNSKVEMLITQTTQLL